MIWGNGGVPGICGKTCDGGVVASVVVLLGVKRLISPERAPLLQHLTPSLLSSTSPLDSLTPSPSPFFPFPPAPDDSGRLLLSRGEADSSCSLLPCLRDLASVLSSRESGSPRLSVRRSWWSNSLLNLLPFPPLLFLLWAQGSELSTSHLASGPFSSLSCSTMASLCVCSPLFSTIAILLQGWTSLNKNLSF